MNCSRIHSSKHKNWLNIWDENRNVAKRYTEEQKSVMVGKYEGGSTARAICAEYIALFFLITTIILVKLMVIWTWHRCRKLSNL